MNAIANFPTRAGISPLLYRWARWGVASSLAIVVSFSHAVTFEVSTADEFQAALTVAGSNGGDDEILLAAGVYEGNFKYFSQENFSLVIASINDEEPVTIDARSSTYGLYLNNDGYSGSLTIRGLTIQNAKNSSIGAGVIVLRLNGDLVLDSVTIRSNSATNSSALFVAEGATNTEIVRSAFFDNSASEFAIINVESSGKFSFADSTVSQTIGGGAIALSNNPQSIIVENSKFVDNRTGNDAWAMLFLSTFGELKFSENTVTGNNGSFRFDAAEANISKNVFENNDCYGTFDEDFQYMWSGIAIMGRSAGKISFESNIIRGLNCRANFESDGSLEISSNLFNAFPSQVLIKDQANLRFLNNTLVSNVDPALRIRGDTDARVAVQNNIFLNDDGPSLGLLELGGLTRSSTLTNNILASALGVWDTRRSNFDLDPMLHDISRGDFRPVSDSPAIDSGTNDALSAENQTDLDGNPRVLSGTVDIGAFERNTAPLHPADTNGDSSISSDEFNAYNAAWRANDVWPTAPAVITADFVTRAGYLLQKGGDYKNIGVGKPQTWVPVNE